MVDVSFSTTPFNDRDLFPALDAVADAGFTNIEISSMPPHLGEPLEGAELEALKRGVADRGFTGCTIHAPMRENTPGAPEEDWRKEKVGVISSYLHLAGALCARGLIIHTVPNPIFVNDPRRPELRQIMQDATRRSLDELVHVAQQAGARMLLENLPYATQHDCNYPFLNMTELRPLVDEYPPDALGLVIDTGHAWTAGIDPVGEIRTAGERLGGTHLQDVDYENPNDNHWMPTAGGLDWSAIRMALGEVGYDDHWTYEVIHSRQDETPEGLAKSTWQTVKDWGPE